MRLKLLVILELFLSKIGDKNRFLGVDGQAGHGLKETAGTSSQVRHHVGAVCDMSPVFKYLIK